MTTKLIAERGFWGLSMQDVADGCGLTVPGMLHHVGSKDSLLVAVLEYRDEQDSRSLAEKLGRPAHQLWTDGGRISLAEVCAAVVARNAEQPEIVRLFAVLEAESLAPGHPAHTYFKARQRRTLEEFAALADGVVDDPQALAAQVVAMMDGLQIQWLREPQTVDLVSAWAAAARRLFT